MLNRRQRNLHLRRWKFDLRVGGIRTALLDMNSVGARSQSSEAATAGCIGRAGAHVLDRARHRDHRAGNDCAVHVKNFDP